MALKVEFDPDALKELATLDESVQRRIFRYFRERVSPLKDPRALGKPLTGDKKGLWRYRIGDYRAIGSISDTASTVTIYRIGHRRHIYDR
ncbi:MAG: type II toxin-antitoxin system RelE/ParE family toxin [Nitrospinae bacterium]|nr:type II toxin-antitoxin system RelE/ParE family toxin [Nitrospinota bacterium]